MFPSGHHIATAALSPILVIQGLSARRSVPRLPEADGKRAGICGQGKPIRLLILGDSAAAGVGAGHQRDALSGQITDGLSNHYQVHWRVFARTGETTASTLTRLDRLSSKPFDIAVTSLGVNDVTSGTTVARWLWLQAQLRKRLRNELGVRHIVISGLPQVQMFPALPQPLRWHLGARARLFNQKLARQLQNETDSCFLSIDSIGGPDLVAPDGFHPGPRAYSIWGELAADEIKRMLG